jgi:hypothetical protein
MAHGARVLRGLLVAPLLDGKSGGSLSTTGGCRVGVGVTWSKLHAAVSAVYAAASVSFSDEELYQVGWKVGVESGGGRGDGEWEGEGGTELRGGGGVGWRHGPVVA